MPRRDGAFALIAREDNSYFDCEDDGSCGTGGGAESVEGCDNGADCGGGKTEGNRRKGHPTGTIIGAHAQPDSTALHALM
jgi:hypothetical protein